MARFEQLDASDVQTARAVCAALWERLSPAQAAIGRRLFDSLATPRWLLEWRLPRWLAVTFGLNPAETSALLLSNVFGMAYARLHDDLVDGAVAPAEYAATIGLATALDHRWLWQYVQLFDRESPFWDALADCTSQWLQASQPPTRPWAEFTEADFLRLAHSGAMLKLCPAAACLLAGREALLPALATALDHLLVATVLLDHAQDWADDLALGRYNAFVAYASTLPQSASNREANRRNVLAELYLAEAGQPYFALIAGRVRRAVELARPAGCADLDRYLRWLEEQALALGASLAEDAGARLAAVTAQFWHLPMRADKSTGDELDGYSHATPTPGRPNLDGRRLPRPNPARPRGHPQGTAHQPDRRSAFTAQKIGSGGRRASGDAIP